MSSIKELFDSKKFDEVISKVNCKESPSTQERSLRAQSYFAKQQWQESLDDFSHVIRRRGPLVHFRIFQKTRTAINQSRLDKASITEFWRSCSEPLSFRAEAIMHGILEGKERDVVEGEFQKLVKDLFDDPHLQDSWVSSFNMLVSSCRGQHSKRKPQLPPKNKILVSGMGWSGSGAIYDYLQEFPEVHAVKGELTAIQGVGGVGGGFAAFVRSQNDLRKSIDCAVDFFFRALLGYAPMRSAWCLRGLRGPRRYLVHPEWSTHYAEAAQRVVAAIGDLLEAIEKHGHDKIEDKLHALGNSIADNLLALTVPKDKFALLDNSIFINNLELASYLQNAFVTCSIRDPRSNFVALKREKLEFNGDLDAYIKVETKRRPEIKTMFSNMEEVKGEDAVYQWGGSKIQLIQFEEFVTSKRRREQLASKIGLDLRNQKEFEHFKPWDSVKNCKLHQTYEDQSEIQLIAEKLSEYCVEPVITKADAALLDAPPERFRHGAGRRQRAKQALKRLRFWA